MRDGVSMNKKLLIKFTIVVFMSSLSAPIMSHDTTHIHPLITSEIGKFIKDEDIKPGGANAYSDIYEPNPKPINGIDKTEQFLYWGTDYDQKGLIDAQDKVDYLMYDRQKPYKHYNNVIDGVVQEDVPGGKVMDHFFQALTGNALNVPVYNEINSATRAMQFFNESVARMGGYTEDAKGTAFFEFGHALHHVEDMSSPAHIHNDPHLTLLEAEKDDYEGWYLPQVKLDGTLSNGTKIGELFANIGDVKTVNNPWIDTWGKDNPNSMVRVFHAMTTYQGTLQYPVADYSVLDAIVDGGIDLNAPTPSQGEFVPTGELAKMFPCDNGTLLPHCLHWEEDGLNELAHWTINIVGDFIHQYTEQINPNSWWPIETENDDIYKTYTAHVPSSSTNLEPFSAGYYIEQLSTGNTDGVTDIYILDIPTGTPNPLGDEVVKPVNMRTNLKLPWSENNPIISNSMELREIYARNLLAPAVAYSAGFTQYWYDVANTPPYLKTVKVEQKPNAAAEPVIVYEADWKNKEIDDSDTYNDVLFCSPNDLLCYDENKESNDFKIVDSRELDVKVLNTSHVDADQDLIITLTFNEPIRKITELKLGKYTEGVCDIPDNCADITPPKPTFDAAGEPSDSTGEIKFSNETLKEDGLSDIKVWHWEITVDKSKIVDLNGKLTLTVKALDMNKHARGTQCATDGVADNAGGDLDASPDSPAKRDISLSMGPNFIPTEVNCYPWYQSDGIEATTENDSYSYDFKDGDQNHFLIFDSTPPTVQFNIQTTIPTAF